MSNSNKSTFPESQHLEAIALLNQGGTPANLTQRFDAYMQVVNEYLATTRLEAIDFDTCQRKLVIGQALWESIRDSRTDLGNRIVNESWRPELIALDARVDALELRQRSLQRAGLTHSDESVSESHTAASSSTPHIEWRIQPVAPVPQTAAAHVNHAPTPIQAAPPAPVGGFARLRQGVSRMLRALREQIFPNHDRAFLAQAHPQPQHPRASVTQELLVVPHEHHDDAQHNAASKPSSAIDNAVAPITVETPRRSFSR